MHSASKQIPTKSMAPFYRIIRAVARVILSALARVTVTGKDNLPASGPYILVINHLHLVDPVILMCVLPYQVDVLIADKYRKKFPIGQIVKLAGATFVRRGEVDRKALRKCLVILKAGGVLGMSPEGTRSKTGTLQRAKPGVAYFVHKTGAPLLPVATWGTEKALSSWRPFRRQEVRIAIGRLFTLPSPEKRLRSKDLQTTADQIMLRIAHLLPREYWGAYADQMAQASPQEKPSA